jgi:UDPglucose 6-dehydrogenase
MDVTVVGSGYVGLVAGACLAETGNMVRCIDMDAQKIERLLRNDIPIYEPGLEPLVAANHAAGRLMFSTDLAEAVRASQVIFIAVGTPPGEDGSADLQHVLAVAKDIGRAMNGPKIVATKSTVPVGTAQKVRETIERETSHAVRVCSNPEFLKEGAAIEDFMKPDRIIIGVDHEHAREVLGELYAPFVRTGNPILFMDIASAEVTKYAANAMLATRVSFMNQIAEFCERAGADVNEVRRGIGSDRRIGPAFLFPGPGYGGSCFPKDVQALAHSARQFGLVPDLLEAVEAVNRRQKLVPLAKVRRALGGALAGRRVAVWGLAFKAGTDDMREAPAIDLVTGLVREGAEVRVHDPKALRPARELLGPGVVYAEDNYAAAQGADALVVMTEWLMYRNPDFERLRNMMRQPVIVDARNLYEPARMKALGFHYDAIGRRL